MPNGDVTYEVRADYSNVENDLDQANNLVEKKTSAGAEKLKSVAGTTAKAIGAGMAAAGTAVVAVGTAAVNSAVSMDQAMNSFIASTGKGAEEAERYQGILENIYKNNYGEDFQDIADAMGEIRKQIGPAVDSWDDTALQGFTESALALRDTFEYDVAESVRAADAMMEQFGVDGEYAFALIAKGAENGLDYSGELLDSIDEYSVQFAKMGLDADDMFKIFQKGAESGAFNLDKVGDAVKEMSIRVIDGSDTTKEGFKLLGLNADKMAAKFAAGGDSAKEAFNETLDALAAMKDPLAQNTAAVNLMGTMWEDLGPEAVKALADIEDGAYATGEELNKIKEVKYDDLGSMFEGLKRTVEMLLLPLGEQLIPVLSDLMTAIMPIVEEALPPFIEIAGELIEELTPVIEEILPVLIGLFSDLMPPLMDLISSILPVVVDLFKQLIPPITEIISAVLPVLIELIDVLLPIIQILIGLLMPLIDLFMELLAPILSLITEALTPLLEALTPIIEVITSLLIPVLQMLLTQFSEVFAGIAGYVSDQVKVITNIINSIVDFIKNVFTGNWKGAWENIKDIFKNIVSGFTNIFKTPINTIIDMVNGFIKGMNKIKIPDWVPSVGGKGIDLPTIPKLRVGMDYVPSDDFPALLHKGEAVLTAQENALYRSLGGFEGMASLINSGGRSSEIVVNNTTDIDYELFGQAVYAAFKKHGMSVNIDRREFGRIIEEIIKERG